METDDVTGTGKRRGGGAREVARRVHGTASATGPASIPGRRRRGRGAALAAADLEARLHEEGEARRRAERQAELKDEIIDVASHELRGQLAVIVQWLRMLREGGVDRGNSAATRALQAIERAAATQVRVVEDLVELSHAASRALELERRTIEAVPLVAETVDGHTPAAEARGVHLSLSHDGTAPFVEADPARLRQIISTLVAHAVKVTPTGGRVMVAVSSDDRTLRVSVTDSGAGIDRDILPHLFEHLALESAPGSQRRHGLGLGLALARQLVELHGGRIGVDSQGAGRGTTFTVELPRSAPPAPVAAGTAPAPASATPAEQRLRGLRILVVEDEPDAREAIAMMLTRAGAEVEDVGSVSEAMEALRRRLPDIIVSDIAMPGEDGYAFIRKVRALPEDEGGRIPALALTALTDYLDRRMLLAAGFQEHMPKPVDIFELVETVAWLTGR